MNGMKCFWCGGDLGRKHLASDIVGGKEVFFHRGMFKDCKNDFLKWKRTEEERLTRAARSVY